MNKVNKHRSIMLHRRTSSLHSRHMTIIILSIPKSNIDWPLSWWINLLMPIKKIWEFFWQSWIVQLRESITNQKMIKLILKPKKTSYICLESSNWSQVILQPSSGTIFLPMMTWNNQPIEIQNRDKNCLCSLWLKNH